MRNVFVHKEGTLYKVIDKADNTVVNIVEDVLLFNAKYKRHNGIKGWHGVLSEELNLGLIEEIQKIWAKLLFINRKYYPRFDWDMLTPIKDVGMLWLRPNEIKVKSPLLSPRTIEKYCKKWEEVITKQPGHVIFDELINVHNLNNLIQRINQMDDINRNWQLTNITFEE